MLLTSVRFRLVSDCAASPATNLARAGLLPLNRSEPCSGFPRTIDVPIPLYSKTEREANVFSFRIVVFWLSGQNSLIISHIKIT